MQIHPADRIKTHIAFEQTIIHDVFDHARRECSTHRVAVYLPNLPDPWRFDHMSVILGTGEWDNTRHESMRLSGLLHAKAFAIGSSDRKWCGHDWNYWRDMLPHYLSVI